MVYEKTRILSAARKDRQDEEGTTNPEDCTFCERPKSVAYCGDCTKRYPGIRVKKACTQHPHILNPMDLAKCPRCKSTNLLEQGIDEIPGTHRGAVMRNSRDPSARSPSVQRSPPALSSPAEPKFPSSLSCASPPRVSSSPPVQLKLNLSAPSFTPRASLSPSSSSDLLSPETDWTEEMGDCDDDEDGEKGPGTEGGRDAPGRDVGQNGDAVRGGGGAEAAARNPLRCVCVRRVKYILCTKCGFYDGSGERKFIACADHPSQNVGFKFCPECGAETKENMDEHSED